MGLILVKVLDDFQVTSVQRDSEDRIISINNIFFEKDQLHQVSHKIYEKHKTKFALVDCESQNKTNIPKSERSKDGKKTVQLK